MTRIEPRPSRLSVINVADERALPGLVSVELLDAAPVLSEGGHSREVLARCNCGVWYPVVSERGAEIWRAKGVEVLRVYLGWV